METISPLDTCTRDCISGYWALEELRLSGLYEWQPRALQNCKCMCEKFWPRPLSVENSAHFDTNEVAG